MSHNWTSQFTPYMAITSTSRYARMPVCRGIRGRSRTNPHGDLHKTDLMTMRESGVPWTAHHAGAESGPGASGCPALLNVVVRPPGIGGLRADRPTPRPFHDRPASKLRGQDRGVWKAAHEKDDAAGKKPVVTPAWRPTGRVVSTSTRFEKLRRPADRIYSNSWWPAKAAIRSCPLLRRGLTRCPDGNCLPETDRRKVCRVQVVVGPIASRPARGA